MCGKIIGYHTFLLFGFISAREQGIDGRYVSGVSLTCGQNPCKHIWTFAGAADETSSNEIYKCPCINAAFTSTSSLVPSFVGNDYFCDTALSVFFGNVPRTLHTADPLWDGSGCGSTNTCCTLHNPPWFVKDLPSATTDDIEMRLLTFGDPTPIEIVELYVQ